MSGLISDAMPLPAAPTLASDLLDIELRHREIPMSARTFLTGIKAVDQGVSPSLWTGGKLIGVVSVAGPWLIEEIISEHLLSFYERIVRNREPGSGFVIAPHSSSIISSIHSSIVDRLCHPSATKTLLNAIQYLENVQLLQYFDFPGLTESVEEVSALLSNMSDSPAVPKTILYLEGAGIAVENSQRRSGMVQANALLSSLLRTLVHLSRTCPCLLILLDLAPRKDLQGDNAIPSVFASATGSEMGYQPGGALGRTLVGVLDVTVVVHDAHATVRDGNIVEVVKDRTGNTRGQWAVCKLKQSKHTLEVGEYLQPALRK